jgi:hypothetical protein
MSFTPVPGFIWNSISGGGVPSGCVTQLGCETYCKSLSNCIGYNFGEGSGICQNPEGSCYTLLPNDLQQQPFEGFSSYLLIPNHLDSDQSGSNWRNITIILLLCISIYIIKNFVHKKY